MASQEIENINAPLPIDESIGLQDKARLIQQIGIVIIFTVILLAALGLFGQGILSHKTAEADGNTLTYERFGRFGGESTLLFTLTANNSFTQIAVPAAYLEHFKIETIVPEPDKNSIFNNEFIYTFSGRNAKQITFFLSPVKTGSVKAAIRVNMTNFQLSHFIYP